MNGGNFEMILMICQNRKLIIPFGTLAPYSPKSAMHFSQLPANCMNVVDSPDALLSSIAAVSQRMPHGCSDDDALFGVPGTGREREGTLKKILLIGSISKYTTTPVFRFVFRARFRQISLHCVCQFGFAG